MMGECVILTPLRLIRSAEALARMLPTFDLSCGESAPNCVTHRTPFSKHFFFILMPPSHFGYSSHLSSHSLTLPDMSHFYMILEGS